MSHRPRTARASPIAAGRRGAAGRARRAPYVDPGQSELLAAELKFLTGFAKVRMPRGAIHGDLFCDNVLFVGDRVSGIIDFGFAATDFLAYDLAITVNDWCVAEAGFGRARPRARGRTRRSVRRRAAADADERAQWQALLRAAALRFWLSTALRSSPAAPR
jgi:homoserine kinase type II